MTAQAETQVIEAREGAITPGATAVARAARTLAAGSLVAFPTETVYGLGADATNGAAVARVYEAKGRAEALQPCGEGPAQVVQPPAGNTGSGVER